MIRINLLPGPRAKKVQKQWNVEIELAVALGVFLLTVGACVVYSGTLDDEIQAKELDKQTKEREVASLKEKVKKVDDFEAKKKLLMDRNRIIEELEKSRSGPVKTLDNVSRSLEPLRLWLVRLNVKGNSVELEGRALTNDDVVEFVNNLRRTDYFTNIRLLETRSAQETKVTTYAFKLSMSSKG